MISDVGMQGLALARVQDEVPGQSQGGSFGHRSLQQTQDYIKEVASPEERRQKIKGCGLLIGEPSKINVYAVCTQFPQKREA